jgi:hypothetical protein
MVPNMPPDVAQSVYKTLGFVIVAWSWVDFSLNQWVTVSFQNGGRETEAEMPRSFSRRESFLKKCFTTLAPLQPFAPEGRALLTRAAEINGKRDWLAHGTLFQYDPKEHQLTFWKLEAAHKGRIPTVKTWSIALSSLLTVGTQAADLSSEMTDFTKRIMDALMPENDVDQIARRV